MVDFQPASFSLCKANSMACVLLLNLLVLICASIQASKSLSNETLVLSFLATAVSHTPSYRKVFRGSYLRGVYWGIRRSERPARNQGDDDGKLAWDCDADTIRVLRGPFGESSRTLRGGPQFRGGVGMLLRRLPIQEDAL